MMTKQDMVYALAKQVPEMVRGFTISTVYGEIAVPEGWMADRMREHMERTLQCELMALTRSECHNPGDRYGN